MEVFLKDGRHMDVTRIVCTDEKGKPAFNPNNKPKGGNFGKPLGELP